MTRETRMPRTARTGAALAVTALALAACSSGGDEGSTSGAAGTAPSSPAAADGAPGRPLPEVLLAAGETPGGGVPSPLPADAVRQQVDKLVADQGKQLMEDPACDRISRVETPTNHAVTDGAFEAVSYRQSDQDETPHHFVVGLAPGRLADFLDRGLHEACHSSALAANPQLKLNVTVSDAPVVEGAQGFRVTSDLLIPGEDGKTVLKRDISIHGYARGTTTSVEYTAVGDDPAANPVLPTADKAIDSLYTAQMEKLVKSQ